MIGHHGACDWRASKPPARRPSVLVQDKLQHDELPSTCISRDGPFWNFHLIIIFVTAQEKLRLELGYLSDPGNVLDRPVQQSIELAIGG